MFVLYDGYFFVCPCGLLQTPITVRIDRTLEQIMGGGGILKNLGTHTKSLRITFIRYTLRVCTCISHCSMFLLKIFQIHGSLVLKSCFLVSLHAAL